MPRVSVDDNYRFTMQIPPLAKARLLRAAALEHTTLKDFMLRNSLSAADAVIDRAEHIMLSERDTQKVLDGDLDEFVEASLKSGLDAGARRSDAA